MPAFLVPLLWTAGGALLVGGSAGWWGRGETEELLTNYGPTPELSPNFIVEPAAPLTEASMRGQWTPEEMFLRTQEEQRIANAAANRVRSIEGSQDALRIGFGAGLVEQSISPLVLVGIAAGAVGIALIVKG